VAVATTWRSGAVGCVMVAAVALTGCTTTTSGDVQAAQPKASVPSTCVLPTRSAGVPRSYPKPQPRPLTIGWLNPIGSNESANFGERAARKETERLGGKFIAFDSKGRPDLQVTGFQQLLNQKVDAIGVLPLDSNALAPMLRQAAAARVPVIAIDAFPEATNDVGGFTSNLVIGRDLYAFRQAEYLARTKPGATVAVIKFGAPVPSIEYFAERARYWATQCGLKVAATVANLTDDAAGAEQVMTPVLQKNRDLDGVLAYNDSSAIGAVNAARSARRRLTAIGVNGASEGYDAVKDGRIPLSLQLPEITYGIQMVDAAYAANAGTTVPRSVLLEQPYLPITADLIASGQAKTYEQLLTENFTN